MEIRFNESDFGNPEPIDPDKLISEGWRYQDTPRMTYEAWDLFVGLIGEENYRILAMTDGADSQGLKYKRGQFLISPDGIKNMIAYAESGKGQ